LDREVKMLEKQNGGSGREQVVLETISVRKGTVRAVREIPAADK